MTNKYSEEERIEALKLAEEIGAAAAARRLGIKANTIYGWAGQSKKKKHRIKPDRAADERGGNTGRKHQAGQRT